MLLAANTVYTRRGRRWITTRRVIQTCRAGVKAVVSQHEARPRSALRRTALHRVALLTPVEQNTPLDAVAQARLIGQVAAAQDRQAFAALFKHFAPRLKAFHLRAGLSEGPAEELAQETMLLLWRKAASFDATRAGAATWVFTITRNLRIDRARRQHVAAYEPPPEEDSAPSAETLSLEAEQGALMRGALAGLSDEQRRVIELSFFADTPHAAIAAALGLPLGTVKSRIRLALARLRAALGAEP